MDYQELLKKYQALLVENDYLREEISRLKGQQGIPEQARDSF
jgi:cell division protein FtsB